MKPIDHALDRLFRAAAAAPPAATADEEVTAMPSWLQSRILSNRREWLARGGTEEVAKVLSLVRRCLAAAALVAVATALVCHRFEDYRVPAVDTIVLESVAELSLLP